MTSSHTCGRLGPPKSAAKGAAMRLCPICGETRFEGDFECQACGHPYPDDDDEEAVAAG